ncbi:MAG: HAD family hydrolase [Lachnospiraceae bacterium]|nr:HAD family hydrolase [Lachnospiraceae bacterium]
MIKLVASDLDGTLLKVHGGGLAPYTRDVVLRLINSGVHFVAASGRQLTGEYIILDGFGDSISYIAENGAVCVHNGEMLYRSPLAPTLAMEIITEVKKHPDLELAVSCDSGCYIEDKNKAYVEHLTNDPYTKVLLIDDVTNIKEEIIKVTIRYPGDDEAEMLTYIRRFNARFQNKLKIITSGFGWLDFIRPDINKGTTLEKLIAHLGILPEECIAFGDQYNDIEMLQMVGIGYAMADGAPGVIPYADKITDSVEEVLEALILTNQKHKQG